MDPSGLRLDEEEREVIAKEDQVISGKETATSTIATALSIDEDNDNNIDPEVFIDDESLTIEKKEYSLVGNNSFSRHDGRSYRRALLFIGLSVLLFILLFLLPRSNDDSSENQKLWPIPFSNYEELLTAVDNYLDFDGSFNSSSYTALKYGFPIGSWNVSQVTDFHGLFSGYRNPKAKSFNDDIMDWDVSNGVDMTEMFSGASSFDGKLSHWDVSRVTSMDAMFSGATAFSGKGIAKWDVSQVTDMGMMFNEATYFNGDISQWDVSQVKFFGGMFCSAPFFNRDISNWDVSNAESMGKMFFGASSFNISLQNWDIWQVSNMFRMFDNAVSFDQNLCAWGPKLLDMKATSKMTDMFQSTRCPATQTPNLHKRPAPGPFCHVCS